MTLLARSLLSLLFEQIDIRRRLYDGLGALVLVGLLLSALGAQPPVAFAAPPARDCSGGNAAILAPQSGATLTGVIQIEGTASLGAEFSYYKLEVAPMGTEAWGDLVGEAREQVVNGQLGVWDSAAVPDGVYVIRLRVVDPTGNYCEAFATNLRVQNSVTPTPTVFVSPTPEETEAPPIQNAVPTAAPTVETPDRTLTPRPTATPARTRTPPADTGLVGGLGTEELFGAVGTVFGALSRTFLFGMLTMASIFALVGVIYFVRRVL